MLSNTLGFIGMLVALPLLMLAVKSAARTWDLSAELKRKLVHMGMGLATLAFPWIFSHWGVVAGLSATTITFLVLQKRLGGGDVLHSIDRHSLGEIWFAIAVVVVFWWADGDPVLFIIPMLILTLADAAGALFGTGYGTRKFQILSGWKSMEGSMLFLVVAFLSAQLPLLLMTETGRAESILIALILALVAMLFEAISTRGFDNLIVPVASAYLLGEYLELDTMELVQRVVLVCGLLALVLVTQRFSTLEGGAMLGVVLLGYACWAFGDWRFLFPPLVLFGEHLVVTQRLKNVDAEPRHNLFAVLSIALSLMPWLVCSRIFPDFRSQFLGVFITATAIHLAILNLTTRAFVAKRRANFRMWKHSVIKGTCLLALPCWTLVGLHWSTLGWAALSFTMIGLSAYGFVLIKRNPERYTVSFWRWAIQGLVALLGAAPLLLQLI